MPCGIKISFPIFLRKNVSKNEYSKIEQKLLTFYLFFKITQLTICNKFNKPVLTHTRFS